MSQSATSAEAPLMRYRTIVADPPWPYDEGWPGWAKSREERLALPYPSMTLDEIKALPVASLIEPEGYLFLWTTSRYLEDAFAVTRAWTFRPRQTLTWCKPRQGSGAPGGMFATTTEFIIVAQRIGPRSNARGRRTLGERMGSSWFEWPKGGHSEKPDAFLDVVERVAPGPYAELFSRRARFGWDYPIGDQALGGVAANTSREYAVQYLRPDGWWEAGRGWTDPAAALKDASEQIPANVERRVVGVGSPRDKAKVG